MVQLNRENNLNNVDSEKRKEELKLSQEIPDQSSNNRNIPEEKL